MRLRLFAGDAFKRWLKTLHKNTDLNSSDTQITKPKFAYACNWCSLTRPKVITSGQRERREGFQNHLTQILHVKFIFGSKCIFFQNIYLLLITYL
jgi:hypothetical protein